MVRFAFALVALACTAFAAQAAPPKSIIPPGTSVLTVHQYLTAAVAEGKSGTIDLLSGSVPGVPAGVYHYRPAADGVSIALTPAPASDLREWLGHRPDDAPASGTADALDELNARRLAKNLRPFIRDEGLMEAARKCVAYRAARRIEKHTSNDFAFLPVGVTADAAGCAANEVRHGFMACADDSPDYRYAGAATVIGPGGKLYCQLFVRR